MFEWFKKKFGSTKKVSTPDHELTKIFTSGDSTMADTSVKRRPAKLQIQILEKTINEHTDQEQITPVGGPQIMEFATKKDLDEFAARLRVAGQIVKVVGVIDKGGPIETKADPQTPSASQPAPQSDVPVSQPVRDEQTPQHISSPSPTIRQLAPAVLAKPKYYTVSGIDIKDDNGTIYQKQWVRLSEKDASNFRLVNDLNNKIVNIDGKHLEMKRWVRVENVSTETTSDSGIEDELNENQQ